MIRLCSHIRDTKPAAILKPVTFYIRADPRLKCKSKSVFLIHESGFEVIFIISVFFQGLAG